MYIISLTSIRERTDQLKRTLNSLIAQNLKPNAIYVFISREPYLLDEGFDDATVLNLQEMFESVKFIFVPNTGPYRKLIPILKIFHETQQQGHIITVDDDTVYEPNMAKKLLKYATKNIVCCGRSRYADIDKIKFETTNVVMLDFVCPYQKESLNVLPEGVGSICYHSSMFDPVFIYDLSENTNSMSDFEKTNDDIVIRKYLYDKKIMVKTTHVIYVNTNPELERGLWWSINSSIGLKHNR